MKSLALAVFLMGLALAIFLKRSLPSRPEEQSNPARVAVARALSPAAPRQPLVLSRPPVTLAHSAKSPSLAENQVHFQVKDGYAVAFGDVILGKPEEPEVTRGVAQVEAPQFWDSPEIPYVIDGALPNPDRVLRAIRYFTDHTPVRFVPYQGQPDAIVFTTGNENCYSLFGRAGGLQPIRLSDKCGMTEILHETMHALGFIHEQSRTDRDKYVRVEWQNVDPNYRAQFEIVPDSYMANEKGFAFDYHSIMLYRPNLFALQPNLLTLISTGSIPIDPATDGLSPGDIARLKKLFPESSG